MARSSRREFLEQMSGAFAAGVCFPGLSWRSAFGGADDGRDDRVLVVVELAGGNDGLNTVVPFTEDGYYRARPQLGIKDSKVVKLDDKLGLHPELTPLKALWDAGQLAVVNGVGYPRPNRSHFESMDIWHTGDPEQGARRAGWLGRYLEARSQQEGVDPRGMNVGGDLPLAMRAESMPVPSLQGLDSLVLRTDPRSGQDAALEVETIRKLSGLERPGEAETLQFLRRALAGACAEAERLKQAAQTYQAAVSYEGGLGQKLALIARMIDGGFPARVFYTSTGGYDTHAGQEGSHNQLHRSFARALSDFWKDLGAHKHLDRVAVMAFSEFGRRVEENGSRGTDHGTAGPVFVAGGSVRGGLIGQHPSLKDLDQGDLKFTTDFRSIQRTLLENWLGHKATSQSVPTLPLFT